MSDEVKPPWVEYPGEETWWSGWRQGDSEYWFKYEWCPYWRSLNSEEKEKYLSEWDAPDNWRQHLKKWENK